MAMVALLGVGVLGAARTTGALQGVFRLSPVRGLDEFMAIPDDNPLTGPAVLLGRRLFFDPLLSSNGTVSCASCHVPEHAFADTLARSRGVHGRTGRRNAPAIVNRGYGSSFFWDGRAGSLEVQVLEPIQDSLEMNLPIAAAVARLSRDSGYRSAFEGAFRDGVSAKNLSRALAGFLRTIRSGDSPFDRYRDGDTSAISPAARRGASLFFGRANCTSCHVGPNFSDEGFHNTGIAADRLEDGRYSVTRAHGDRGAFKTPTLRDVSRTAPYMHDGSLATLEAVVDFYARGGRANANLDPEVRPLSLSETERADLVAFLRSLTADSATCAPIACAPSPRVQNRGAQALDRLR